jgi:hypothetical protein
MKTLKLIAAGWMLFLWGALHAQFSVNLNFGAPPPWGPVGYSSVHYYYLPDVEAYYDVQASMFIYYGGGAWIHRSYLPERYKGYDLYRGYKVVMTDYRGNTPYTHFKEHKMKYAKGYHGKPQKTNKPWPVHGYPGGKNVHDGHHDYNAGGHENGKYNGNGHDQGKNNGHGNDKGGGKSKNK